ncbi:MAG: fluoride efflux transporter CrcB [Terrimicrobiaceae bacterium]
MFLSYIVVMVGGALGSAARLWLSLFCAMRWGETFPVGTLAVNALGCLAIGVFSALTGPDGMIMTSPLVRQFVMIGILGGFTTFSSFGLQTISLMSDGEWLYAALNIVLSVVACLAFVWLGTILVSLLTHK